MALEQRSIGDLKEIKAGAGKASKESSRNPVGCGPKSV